MVYSTRSSIWSTFIGALMIVLGVAIWFNPLEAIVGLAVYLGVILIVTGVSYFLAYLNSRSNWLLAQALLDILLGVIFLSNIGLTAASLPLMFAFWSFFVGILRITAGFHLYGEGASQWFWVLLSGVLGLVFGFMIWAFPLMGVLSITVFMGVQLIVYGLLLIAEYFSGR